MIILFAVTLCHSSNLFFFSIFNILCPHFFFHPPILIALLCFDFLLLAQAFNNFPTFLLFTLCFHFLASLRGIFNKEIFLLLACFIRFDSLIWNGERNSHSFNNTQFPPSSSPPCRDHLRRKNDCSRFPGPAAVVWRFLFLLKIRVFQNLLAAFPLGIFFIHHTSSSFSPSSSSFCLPSPWLDCSVRVSNLLFFAFPYRLPPRDRMQAHTRNPKEIVIFTFNSHVYASSIFLLLSIALRFKFFPKHRGVIVVVVVVVLINGYETVMLRKLVLTPLGRFHKQESLAGIPFFFLLSAALPSNDGKPEPRTEGK